MLETIIDIVLSDDPLIILRGVVPCLAIIFIGYLTGRFDHSEHEKTLSSLGFFVFTPCLVFTGIHRHTFTHVEITILALASVVVVLFLVPPVFYFNRLFYKDGGVRGRALPMIFASSGTLLMPLAYLLYGNEGLAKAAMFHLFSTFLLFTYGTWLIDGSIQVWRFFRNPMFFAAFIAVMSVEQKFILPADLKEVFRLIENSFSIIGYGAIPFLLFSFGYPFSRVDRGTLIKSLPSGFFRMLAGPLMSFLAVLLLRHFGLLSTVKGYNVMDYIDMRTTEAVIILAGATPGALSGYFINLRNNPDTATDSLAIMVASTIIGVISIPFTLVMVNRFILLA